MPSETTALLEARAVAKRYGGAIALQPSDFSVSRGAVHGLLGKNGAGKSTLVGLVAGSFPPSEGRIVFDGEDITGLSVAERRARGIHLLSQHVELVPDLTVAENLLFPQYPRRLGTIDWPSLRRTALGHLERYELDVPVDAPAGSLSIAEQRRLNIVRTLVNEGRLVMLDEPTTALERSERNALFAWIRNLNAQGETFVFISHMTTEIRELCTEYTVLRDGAVAARGGRPRDLRPAELASQVSGRDIDVFERERMQGRAGPVALRLQAFTNDRLEPTDLEVRRGEIVGLVGLPGSGARELARALGGFTSSTGDVVLEHAVAVGSVAEAQRAGIAYLPGDRITEGVIPELSSRENVVVGHWPTSAAGLIDSGRVERIFRTFAEKLSIRVHDDRSRVGELSGGNQQKVLFSRVLRLEPKVLILDEPTLGIDVEAKEEVHRAIDRATRDGTAVLVLAYDPDELVRLVDRALVFHDGRLTDELLGDDLTIDSLTAAIERSTATEEAP